MSQPTFFGEGSTPRVTDTRWRILQKILGATLDGGGGGGGGGNPVTDEALGGGAPTTAATDIVFDTDTGQMWYSSTKAAPWSNF